MAKKQIEKIKPPVKVAAKKTVAAAGVAKKSKSK
jgi:hypothetical protein